MEILTGKDREPESVLFRPFRSHLRLSLDLRLQECHTLSCMLHTRFSLCIVESNKSLPGS